MQAFPISRGDQNLPVSTCDAPQIITSRPQSLDRIAHPRERCQQDPLGKRLPGQAFPFSIEAEIRDFGHWTPPVHTSCRAKKVNSEGTVEDQSLEIANSIRWRNGPCGTTSPFAGGRRPLTTFKNPLPSFFSQNTKPTFQTKVSWITLSLAPTPFPYKQRPPLPKSFRFRVRLIVFPEKNKPRQHAPQRQPTWIYITARPLPPGRS